MIYYLNFDPYPKQKMFMACPANEVLFGGAVGGSKSASSIIKALQLACKYPNTHIGLFRTTLVDLRATLLKEMYKWVPRDLFHYSTMERRAFLINGSEISFNYISCPADRENYSSWEFDVIIIDESTTMDEGSIVFLKTRARSSKDIPVRQYYLTNPIGISKSYFKKRFVDGRDPFKLYKTEETKHMPDEGAYINGVFTKPEYNLFMPSYLTDNPSILKKDPNYIRRLSQLPQDEFEALLFGSWELRSGLFFKEWDPKHHVIDEYEHAESDTLYGAFDWGFTRPSSIGFYAQRKSKELCRFDEIYTMKDGMPDNGTELTATGLGIMLNEHLWQMKKTIGKIPKMFIADSQCWANDPTSNESIIDHLYNETREHGIVFIKASKSRIQGWQSVKRYLTYKKFTATKNCVHFIRTLPDLLHDPAVDSDLNSKMEDHCVTGDTLIITKTGLKKICKINVGEMVLTREGYNKVTKVFFNGYKKVYLLNNILKITGNHRVYTNNGWRLVDELGHSDIIETWKQNQLFSMGLNIGNMESIMSVVQQINIKGILGYIGIFGLLIMGKFQSVMLFIISILTARTTRLKTYNSLKEENTRLCTLIETMRMKNIVKEMKCHLIRLEKQQLSGMDQMKVKSGTQCMVNTSGIKLKEKIKNALFVGLSILHHFLQDQSIVQGSVKQLLCGEEGVYNLEVENCPEYYANGLLVHNCADEFRYLCNFVPQPSFTEKKVFIPVGSMAWHDEQVKLNQRSR